MRLTVENVLRQIGATYRISARREGIKQEFVAESGKNIRLPDVALDFQEWTASGCWRH